MNPFLSLDPDSRSDWADRANCKGKAFELFEYQEVDSPLAKDMKTKTRLQFNYTNFELAAEICIECPVFFECGEHATEDDKYWTVRQGEPPGRFTQEKEAYERKGKYKPSRRDGEDRICQRGHLVKGGGRCRECKKATNQRHRARLKAASGVE